jgi:Fic family protein
MVSRNEYRRPIGKKVRQTRPKINELKVKLVRTNIQKKIYSLLDGAKTAKEVAVVAKCSEISVWKTLPDWEAKGLIIGVGKGKAKKYVSMENLEV